MDAKLHPVTVMSLQLLLLGIIGQWLVKPALGMALASTLVPLLGLPSQVATGLVLVSLHAGCSDLPVFRCLHVLGASFWSHRTVSQCAAAVLADQVLLTAPVCDNCTTGSHGMAS